MTVDRTVAPEFKKVRNVNLQQALSGKLVNGIPLHVIDAGSQPIIKLELVFHSGKWFEPSEGVSYFTTKMLSEGTLGKSSLQLSRFFDQYGAFLELSPGFDYNTVAVYVLLKHFPAVTPVLKEVLTTSTFPFNEFQVLKNNTLSDLKVKKEKISVLATRKFRELIFGGNYPYGRELSEDHVNKLESPEILKGYFDNCFSNKMEIIAAGQVSDDEIDLIHTHFSDYPAVQVPKVIHNVPLYEPKKETIVKENSSQSSVRIGKRLFTKGHPDFIKMLVVNEILGGYFGSRLMKNIREEKGYTYGIYSRVMSFKEEGYFGVSMEVIREHTCQAIDEVHKEIIKLQQNPVPEDELETVKNEMIGGFLSEVNSPFALADKFKAVHFQDLDYAFYQNFVDTINHITPEEIMTTAQQYLKVDEMTEVIVGGKS